MSSPPRHKMPTLLVLRFALALATSLIRSLSVSLFLSVSLPMSACSHAHRTKTRIPKSQTLLCPFTSSLKLANTSIIPYRPGPPGFFPVSRRPSPPLMFLESVTIEQCQCHETPGIQHCENILSKFPQLRYCTAQYTA